MAIQKILVVDDSAVERYHLTDFLSKQGYAVLEAMDGEDAIAKARSHKPDLILMDVVMPGANGFQITRTLSRDPDLEAIPVIMCTAKDGETDKVWGLRQGARGYLTKPIEYSALLSTIAQMNLVLP